MSDAKPIDPDKNEMLPAEGSPEIGYQIFRYLEEILMDKNLLGLPKKWQRNYELSRNKHWKGYGTSRMPLVSANLLHDHRQKTVNMLTDNNPTFNVAIIGAPGEIDEDTQNNLLHAVEYWWNEQEQQHVLEKSVITGEIYGCAIEKVVFNPELEYGIGEVETELVDPFHFGFYPVTAKDIQKAEAVFHFYPIACRELRRMYPKYADKIKADMAYIAELQDTRREISATNTGMAGSYFSTFMNVVKQMVNNSTNEDSRKDETLVVEVWVKDYRMDKDQPRYQGFLRCITVCNGGAIVLDDRNNPSINPLLDDKQAQKTYLYDRFPFTLTSSITDPLILWGMSDFEQLEQLQIEINKTVTQITLYKDKASRLKIINPKDSGVPNDHFTNYPGVINPTSSMTSQGIRYMEPPQMPADLAGSLQVYQNLFNQISGQFDMEQAQDQGNNVIAYKAIAALIERATTILRGKIRNYGKMMRERGRMYLSHLLNWYDEDRWITFQEGGRSVTKAITGTAIDVPVKLMVVSGSTMPRSRVQEREEAIELFKIGAIDGEELLKKMDWSDRTAVLKRMQAGPYGQLFEKMQAMGMPDQIMQEIQQLSQVNDRDFQIMQDKGEVPQVNQILQQAMTQQPPLSPQDQTDIQVKQATIQKTMAEIELIKAKSQSEMVDQQVKQAGVGFDGQKLNIEKAQTLNTVEQTKHQQMLDKARFMKEQAMEDHKKTLDKANFMTQQDNTRQRTNLDKAHFLHDRQIALQQQASKQSQDTNEPDQGNSQALGNDQEDTGTGNGTQQTDSQPVITQPALPQFIGQTNDTHPDRVFNDHTMKSDDQNLNEAIQPPNNNPPAIKI